MGYDPETYGHPHPMVGSTVEYVDPVGKSQEALVTAVWGEFGVNPINIVFVTDDKGKTDPYGRQIERATSVQAAGPATAHGRFYRVKLRAVK